MSYTFFGIVRNLSHKGMGVLEDPSGMVYFCRGVWPGDEGYFSTETPGEKYSEVKCLEIVKYSEDRVEVLCPHRGVELGFCGGCPWMIADYNSQLKFKEQRLKYFFLKRNLQIDEKIFKPIIASENIYQYRNRAQFKTNGKVIGYVSEGSRTIAPVEDCLILEERPRQILKKIISSLPDEKYAPTEGFNWNYIDVDDEMIFEDVKLNKRRPFKQGNSLQNEKMKKWLIDKVSKVPHHYPVIDLFSGSGNFTEILSTTGFKNILAVEVQGVALDLLKKKNLPYVRILELDMERKGAWAQVAKAQPHGKLLILDPPRSGIQKRRGLFKYLDNLEIIIYISCEMESFARDAQDFKRYGWNLEELVPLDLFPHTPHLEILSVFSKI